jgi:hypothetical protein
MKDETLDRGWEKKMEDEFNTKDISDDTEICFLKSELKQFITNLLAEQKAEIIERVEKLRDDEDKPTEAGLLIENIINLIKEV